jgi:signal transduction histidine kinase
VLRTAAARVATAVRHQPGGGGDAQAVKGLLAVLVALVQRRLDDPDAPIAEAARSRDGRRLLKRLHAELQWEAAHGGAGGSGGSGGSGGAGDARLDGLVAAAERLRGTIEADGAQDFVTTCGPEGTELLVNVAHDFRSPLTSILFLAETLQRGQSGPVNEVQRRQLGLIYGAALGLSSVASDLIELARGGDHLAEKEAVPFSLTGVLESVRGIAWPIAEEKHLDIRLLPPVTDQRMGHPVALSRVLLNLTTNALKFTDTGFVEIVTRETAPGRVEFAVRDSGRGIDPAIVESLYRPLREVAGRPGRAFSPTGLGLTMCRTLVEAMGSELEVETRRGWGTRFFFELALPASAPMHHAPRGRSAARPRRMRPKAAPPSAPAPASVASDPRLAPQV